MLLNVSLSSNCQPMSWAQDEAETSKIGHACIDEWLRIKAACSLAIITSLPLTASAAVGWQSPALAACISVRRLRHLMTTEVASDGNDDSCCVPRALHWQTYTVGYGGWEIYAEDSWRWRRHGNWRPRRARATPRSDERKRPICYGTLALHRLNGNPVATAYV